MTLPTVNPLFQAFDHNGNPLSGGKLYTYSVGTTSSKTTYSDYDLQTANANPIILNARGEATVYIAGPTKFVLKDSSDYTIWTFDNIGTGNIITLADEGTPTVLGGRSFVTGGTTTITDFDDGHTGQIITVISAHAVTITDGTNILLSGSKDFVMAASDTLTLIQKSDTKWYEMARSQNGVTTNTISTLANDATPTVLNGSKFLTGGTTTITDFDDGVTGQEITIIAEHTVSITDGTNIFLRHNNSLELVASDTLTLIQKADGLWYETGRSLNGAVISDTTTNLANVSNAINTTSKGLGKRVWNTTTNLYVYSTGTAAADVWNNEAGATAHSPV